MPSFDYSDKGLELTKQFEGLKLTAYADPVGVWTIGYGHTGNDVHEGLSITSEWADELLRHDSGDAIACVQRNLNGIEGVTQGMFDALVDFTFNLGCGSLKGSTLLTLVRLGKFDLASAQFGRWNKAGGKVLAGLTLRREAERKLFLSEAEVV